MSQLPRRLRCDCDHPQRSDPVLGLLEDGDGDEDRPPKVEEVGESRVETGTLEVRGFVPPMSGETEVSDRLSRSLWVPPSGVEDRWNSSTLGYPSFRPSRVTEHLLPQHYRCRFPNEN